MSGRPCALFEPLLALHSVLVFASAQCFIVPLRIPVVTVVSICPLHVFHEVAKAVLADDFSVERDHGWHHCSS